MTDNTHPTLGQRIDAVLEPLYAEAEQHRATITKASEAQQALQEKIDIANQGLALIESRMAQVVKSLAQQEPIIAAMFGGQSQLDAIEPTTDTATEPAADEAPSDVAVIESEVQADADGEPTPEASASPADAPTAELATPAPTDADQEPAPAIELDPVADAKAVNEVAAMLDAPPKVAPAQVAHAKVEAEAPTQAETETETELETEAQADADPVAEEASVEDSAPAPANITAAAERAAIAAKQLRDKATATR